MARKRESWPGWVSGFGRPAVLVVEGGGGGERHFDVPALHRKVEARLLVLDELQRHLPPSMHQVMDPLVDEVLSRRI